MSVRLSYNFDIIKNQPINLTYNEVNCKDSANDIQYSNIVSYNDVTQLQFELNPLINDVQLLLNSEFTTNLDGWTQSNMQWVSGGLVENISPTASFSQIYITPHLQYMAFGLKAFMRVDFGIDINSNGCLLKAGRGELDLNPNEVGNFTVYGMFGDTLAVDNNILAFFYGATATISAHNVRLNYIRAYPINYDYIFIIRNLNTGAIEYKYKLREFFDNINFLGLDPFNISGNKLTWTIDWSNLSLADGCYRIEVCDVGMNNEMQNGMYNQDFNYASAYLEATASGGVFAGYTGDSTISVDFTASGSLVLEQILNISSGITFNYTVGITAHSGTNVTFRIGFFSGDDDIHTISGTGTFTGDLTSNGTDAFAFQFSKLTSGNASVKIDYILLTLADENDNLNANYVSTNYVVSGDECNSIVLHGCSDINNTFGFNFLDSGFTLRSRVVGKLINANYNIDKASYYYGELRNIRTAYFSRKKVKQLVLDLLPEYMLDFVTALIGLDHIYIDNVEYALDDENFFTLTYNDALNNAGYIVLNLFELNSTILHKPNISLGVGCNDVQDYVIDPVTGDPVIDPITGSPIISLS
jgi:hypothetical protein